jgi:uncharacterized phiE125 gp8 family phage protein
MRPHYSIAEQPELEPVTYGDCAEHLRVDSEEDIAYVSSLIPAARELIDSLSGRASTLATYRVVAPTWRSLMQHTRQVPLYRVPLVSIDSVKYYDDGGTLQTLGAGDYIAVTGTEPGTLVLTGDLPSVFSRPDAVQVEFKAGHEHAGDVPQVQRHLIKMMVHHLYEQREFINVGNIVTKIPLTMNMMLNHIKVGGWVS